LHEAIKRIGATVETAPSACEALGKIEQGRWGAIITDVHLPKGLDCLDAELLRICGEAGDMKYHEMAMNVIRRAKASRTNSDAPIYVVTLIEPERNVKVPNARANAMAAGADRYFCIDEKCYNEVPQAVLGALRR